MVYKTVLKNGPIDKEVNRLIKEGAGAEFRFFASGPVKREYVALSDSAFADDDSVRQLLKLAIQHVTNRERGDGN